MERKRVLVIGGGNACIKRIRILAGDVIEGEIDCSHLVSDIAILDIENPDKVRSRIGFSNIPVYNWETIKKVVDEKGAFDVAFICTPIDTHLLVFYQLVFFGLSRRVLIEKPFASNSKEAIAIERSAKENGIKIFCGYNLNFSNPMRRLKTRLAQTGAVPFSADLTYTKMHKKKHPIPGVILEEGPSQVDLITSVMGMPTGAQVRYIPIRIDPARNAKGMEEKIFQDSLGSYQIDRIQGEFDAQFFFPQGNSAVIYSSFQTALEHSLRVDAMLPSEMWGNKFITFRLGFTNTEGLKPFFEECSGKKKSARRTTFFEMSLGDPFGEETKAFLDEEYGSLCSACRAIEIQRAVDALEESSKRIEEIERVGGDSVLIPGDVVSL